MRILVATLALAAALAAAPVLAAQQRSFVASSGLDTNACTLAAPCRSFGAAIAQTNDGGEVVVLDSAGYGKVTIAKSVALISPPGIYAGISVFAGDDGVTINAPGKIVVLRGLSINGQGGNIGVSVVAAARVRIEGCEVSGMASNGIAHIAPGSSLTMLDTVVRDNGGTGIGIAGSATVVLDRVRSHGNGYDGLYATASTAAATSVSVSESVFSGNANNGIFADAAGGGAVYVKVERSTLDRNGGNGLLVKGKLGGFSEATISNSALNLNSGWGASLDGNASFVTGVFVHNRLTDNGAGGVLADGSFAQAVLNGGWLLGIQPYCPQGGATMQSTGNNFALGLPCVGPIGSVAAF